MRTIIIDGKGRIARLVFTGLQVQYPEAVLQEHKMKWWQLQTRYSLMILHLDPAEIVELGKRVGYWDPPIFTMRVY